MGAQQPHEEYLKQAEQLNPAANIPRLRQISPRVADKCDAPQNDSEQYHCRNIERAVYWFANSEQHTNPRFRRAFGSFGTMHQVDEKAQAKDLYYHVRELLDDEHPAVINAVSAEFQDYFKIAEIE